MTMFWCRFERSVIGELLPTSFSFMSVCIRHDKENYAVKQVFEMVEKRVRWKIDCFKSY